MSTNRPDTYSQDWQLECLARYILNLPSKPERLKFINMLREKRAPKNASAEVVAEAERFVEDLRQRIMRQHELRKASQMQALQSAQ